MAKTQIITKQVNSKNTADSCVCPHVTIVKQRPVFACKRSCDRFVGIEAGFVLCGQRGANKDVLRVVDTMRKPSLWEVFGEGERGWMVGSYGKPKG